MNFLDGAQAKHLLIVFAAGIVGGLIVVLVDNYVVMKLESAVGVTPGQA
jgi:hypothetical protein